MSMTRRTALRTLPAMAAAAATAVAPRRAAARRVPLAGPKAVAVLYDPTRCIGCQECIRACAVENDCSVEMATSPKAQLSTRSLTVLQKYQPADGPATFRKVQCMHCVDPACASACMLGAMSKREDGAVEWNGDLCVGCRYCEIACPFNVPRFEWDTPTPRLTKCQLCPERRAQGLAPACVDRCRMGALTYGLRSELVAEAHRRIEEHPERYNPKVYGERDGGGTSVLYLAKAGVAFAAMGLPALGEESVPELPETIQHTLYRGFAAPAVLLGLFGAVVRRNSKLLHRVERDEAAHDHHGSKPVGGRIMTWPFMTLLALFLIGLTGIGWRFFAGLGATTNLNDGYPMGLWIAFDVVTGTALACGGYAVAILVYLLNRGKYHPLVRAAIVTSALGYTLGGLSVLIDIGRAWNFYKIPLFFSNWNFNSILLEVALCIMCYTMVLWIELSPALLEGWRESRFPALRRLAVAALPRVEKAMPYVIAVGLLLPTMHQSSLGSLMLLAGSKLHPLWRTPLLPLLFLVSCVAMGYAAVVLEATISSRVFRRPSEVPMLRALAGPIAVVLLGYVLLRLYDVYDRGLLAQLTVPDRYTLLFHLEMTLFTLPALLLAGRRWAGAALLSGIAVVVIGAGTLYRFSTYLIAYDPGAEWSYFPALPEILVTVGLVAAELMGYLVLVKKFPILRGAAGPRLMVSESSLAAGAGAAASCPVELALAAPKTAAPERAGTAAAMISAGLVLAFLLGSEPLAAQGPSRAPDRRCLTAGRCLEQPLLPDEPHEGRCATCHDFSTQPTPAAAARTCVGCHGSPATLTPMHRGFSPRVQRNCIGCHPPHDVRIRTAGTMCGFCHATGGQLPAHGSTPAPEVPRRVTATLMFRHSPHRQQPCTACHAPKLEHTETPVMTVATCQSCHHSAASGSSTQECLSCHRQARVAAVRTQVTRTLDIRVGKLVRPERVLPFDHSLHLGTECSTCHMGAGPELAAAASDCDSCHAPHSNPDAACSSCHEQPPAGAHTRAAHLGCDGAGCHQRVPEGVRQQLRARPGCLACHGDRAEHHPDRNCVECHLLPPPRATTSVAANGQAD